MSEHHFYDIFYAIAKLSNVSSYINIIMKKSWVEILKQKKLVEIPSKYL